MIKLLRIEFRKQVTSVGFWILLFLHIAVLLLAVMNLNSFLQNAHIMIENLPDLDLSLKSVLQFPDIWQNLTYISSYFKIILALIVVTSVSNEFTNGTARQNIIDGLSRREWIYTKIGLAKLLAMISTGAVLIMGVVIGFSQEAQIKPNDVYTGLGFVVAYFIELLTYFTYALFLGTLFKRTGLAIILLLVYDFILEPVLSLSLPTQVRDFLPMNAIDSLNKFPFTKYVDAGVQSEVSMEQLLWAISYGALFAIFTYLIVKRRDL